MQSHKNHSSDAKILYKRYLLILKLKDFGRLPPPPIVLSLSIPLCRIINCSIFSRLFVKEKGFVRSLSDSSVLMNSSCSYP